jgi:phage shock protein A
MDIPTPKRASRASSRVSSSSSTRSTMEYTGDDLRRVETKIDELLTLMKAHQQALTPERSHRHHQQLQLKFSTVEEFNQFNRELEEGVSKKRELVSKFGGVFIIFSPEYSLQFIE